MAGAQAKRGVQIVIGTELAQGFDRPLKQLEARIAELQRSASNIAVNFGTVGPAAVAARNGSNGNGNGHASGGAGSRRGNRIIGFAGANGSAIGPVQDSKQVDRAIQDIARFQRAADEAQRKEDERAKKAEERARNQEEVEKRKAAANALKTAQAESRKRGKLEQQVVAKENKYREDQDKKKEQDKKKADRQAQEAAANLREAYSRVTSSITATTTAVTTLGEGFAYLGLVGEKNLHNLTDSLLTIRGYADSIRGGIGTLRDAGDLVRNIRAARAAGGGVAGYGRALLGLPLAGAPALATGGTTAATGATTTAGTAGVAGGTAATGAALPAAAAASTIAAIVSSVLTYREARKHGIGGGATYGSFVDKAATLEVGLAMKLANLGHMVGLSDNFMRGVLNSPLGGPAGFLFAPSVDAAASGRKTERMQEAQAKARTKRQEDDERVSAQLAEKQSERERYLDVQARRHAAGAYSNPVDVVRGGRIDANAGRMAALVQKGAALAEERADTDRKLAEARADAVATRGKGGAHDAGHGDAMANLEKMEQRSNELRERELALARETRQVDIEGARQKLQLLESQLAKQKEMTAGARGHRDDFAARFARMNPMQRQAVIGAKQKLKRKEQLNEMDANLIRENGDEESQRLLREQEVKRGRAFYAGTGVGNSEEQAYQNAKEKEAVLRQNRADTQREAERTLGIKAQATINNQIAITMVASSDLEQQLSEQFDRALEIFGKNQNERMEAWFHQAESAMNQKASGITRRANNQARQLAS